MHGRGCESARHAHGLASLDLWFSLIFSFYCFLLPFEAFLLLQRGGGVEGIVLAMIGLEKGKMCTVSAVREVEIEIGPVSLLLGTYEVVSSCYP
eukprot:jgi/Botrbrau1/1119/Bobra.0162s0017.1